MELKEALEIVDGFCKEAGFCGNSVKSIRKSAKAGLKSLKNKVTKTPDFDVPLDQKELERIAANSKDKITALRVKAHNTSSKGKDVVKKGAKQVKDSVKKNKIPIAIGAGAGLAGGVAMNSLREKNASEFIATLYKNLMEK